MRNGNCERVALLACWLVIGCQPQADKLDVAEMPITSQGRYHAHIQIFTNESGHRRAFAVVGKKDQALTGPVVLNAKSRRYEYDGQPLLPSKWRLSKLIILYQGQKSEVILDGEHTNEMASSYVQHFLDTENDKED